jgi:polyphenol oxidase
MSASGRALSQSPPGIEIAGRARVLFTDRHHGNLSSVGGEGAEHGAQARQRLRELTGVRQLAHGYQVHGTLVQRVRELQPEERQPLIQPREADGQATTLEGVGVMVLSADCLPVALGCQDAVAMLHAGWRGLAAGVLEEGVSAMRELSPGCEIVAVVGPGAGPCCYEVGPNVHGAFGNHNGLPDARTIDLRAIAHERLLAAGVTEVRDVAACTLCDERYFSHRRQGARAGRQGGVAWLS